MKVRIDNVRFSQIYVHELGKKFDENSVEKYSAHGIVEKDHPGLVAVKDAIVAAAKEMWPNAWENKLKLIKASGTQWVLRDGDAKADKNGDPIEAYAGKMFIAAKSESKPLIVDGNREPLNADTKKPYAGSYGSMIIDIRASDMPKPQVYALLLGVQFTKDGDSLGGGAVARRDDFEAIPTAKPAAGAEAASAESLF
jgi:hypothetical protein